MKPLKSKYCESLNNVFPACSMNHTLTHISHGFTTDKINKKHGYSQIASDLGPNVVSSWHCWPPVCNGMYPFSQSWAICVNYSTAWITANNTRADCWWEDEECPRSIQRSSAPNHDSVLEP